MMNVWFLIWGGFPWERLGDLEEGIGIMQQVLRRYEKQLGSLTLVNLLSVGRIDGWARWYALEYTCLGAWRESSSSMSCLFSGLVYIFVVREPSHSFNRILVRGWLLGCYILMYGGLLVISGYHVCIEEKQRKEKEKLNDIKYVARDQFSSHVQVQNHAGHAHVESETGMRWIWVWHELYSETNSSYVSPCFTVGM